MAGRVPLLFDSSDLSRQDVVVVLVALAVISAVVAVVFALVAIRKANRL